MTYHRATFSAGARVKITFITLCNQLVKAIPLKASGEGGEVGRPRSRLLLHNHDTGRPTFTISLGLAAITVSLFFRGLTLKIISVTGGRVGAEAKGSS